VYCVWQVVETPTIILNNPVFKWTYNVYAHCILDGTDLILPSNKSVSLMCKVYVDLNILRFKDERRHENHCDSVQLISPAYTGKYWHSYQPCHFSLRPFFEKRRRNLTGKPETFSKPREVVSELCQFQNIMSIARKSHRELIQLGNSVTALFNIQFLR